MSFAVGIAGFILRKSIDTFGNCVKQRSIWIPLLCYCEHLVPTRILKAAFLVCRLLCCCTPGQA